MTKTFADEVGCVIHEMFASLARTLSVFFLSPLQASSSPSSQRPFVDAGHRIAMAQLSEFVETLTDGLLELLRFTLRLVNALARVAAAWTFYEAHERVINPMVAALFPGPANPMAKAVNLGTEFAFLFLLFVLLIDMILCFVGLDLVTSFARWGRTPKVPPV